MADLSNIVLLQANLEEFAYHNSFNLNIKYLDSGYISIEINFVANFAI